MIQQQKIYASVLIAGMTVLALGSTVALAEDLAPAWRNAFPLKQSRNKEPVRYDSHRSGPPISDLHLIEHDTEVRRDQIDPLHAVVQIDFPVSSISNVRQAVAALLRPMGYDLLDGGSNTSELLQDLLTSPLPEVQRSFRNVRASEVLRAFAGVGYIVVVDHVRRRVTFDPKPLYLSIGGNSVSDIAMAGQSREAPENRDDSLLKRPLVPAQPQTWQEVPGYVPPVESVERATEIIEEPAPDIPPASVQPDVWMDVPEPRQQIKGNTELSEKAVQPIESDAGFRNRILANIVPLEEVGEARGRKARWPDSSVIDTLVQTVTVSREDALMRETQLRKVASQYNNSNDVVTITSCAAGGNEASVKRNQKRLTQALIRLGVSKASLRERTPNCEQRSRKHLSHIELVRADTIESDGIQ